MMNGWDEGDEGHTMATKAMTLIWEGLQSTGDTDNVSDVTELFCNGAVIKVFCFYRMEECRLRNGVTCGR